MSVSAVGVDPQDAAMAGEPHDGQHAARHAPQAGGVPRLPPQAQAPQAERQSSA